MPLAVMTDAARTVIGPDDPAAPVRVIIGRRIVEVPVKMVPVMPDPEPALAKPAATEPRGGNGRSRARDIESSSRVKPFRMDDQG